MTPWIIGLLSLAVLAAAALVIAATVAMKRDPDLHIWPAVTRCRVCEKRVFIWQAQEFRPYLVRLDNPDMIPEEMLVKISASGIVHKGCRGTPNVTVTVRRRKAVSRLN